MTQKTDNQSRQLPIVMPASKDRLTPAQQAVHKNFMQAVDDLKKNLVRTIFYLRAVVEGRIHKLLGFSRITEYAAHYTGLSERQTKELLLLGKRLAELPGIADALARGDLSWSTAREISRIASPGDQQRWIDLARSVSRQELRERLKSGVLDPQLPAIPDEPSPDSISSRPRPGSPPRPVPPRPPAPRPPAKKMLPPPAIAEQHLRIRMTTEQYAIWESLLEQHRRRRPGVTAVEIVLEKLASAVEQDGGRAPYLVVVLACPDCGEARIPTCRGEAKADDALLSAAHCDGVFEQPDGGRRQTVMPRLRRLALQRARYRCEVEGCRHTRFLEVHHRLPVAGGGHTELENLIVLCSRCHRNLHDHESALNGQLQNIERLAHQWPRSEEGSSR